MIEQRPSRNHMFLVVRLGAGARGDGAAQPGGGGAGGARLARGCRAPRRQSTRSRRGEGAPAADSLISKGFSYQQWTLLSAEDSLICKVIGLLVERRRTYQHMLACEDTQRAGEPRPHRPRRTTTPPRRLPRRPTARARRRWGPPTRGAPRTRPRPAPARGTRRVRLVRGEGRGVSD